MQLQRPAFFLLPFVLLTLIIFNACSGGNGGDSSPKNVVTFGTVALTVSDPPTCAAPQGPYRSVFVTVKDVQIHQSASAAATDAGWVDLTPSLTPTQIDLLGTANTSCFLASLGSNTQIPAGNYQQLRIILQSDSGASSIANNRCGNGLSNCVILASDGSVHSINLSSEATTGIKIPSGQIAGGQFVVDGNQTNDLNIDFNACASIVIQGNGQYRLKPVLHAGEVSINTSSVSGQVVDSITKSIIQGGKVVVTLETIDSTTGLGRVVMEAVPDSAGNFVFCPVSAGTYVVVAVGIDGNGVAYAPTVLFGVQPGTVIGQVPLVAPTGASTAPANITGRVTSSNTSGTGTSIDVSLATIESVVSGTTTSQLIVPQAATSSATLSLATQANAACPANTQCANYSVQVPASLPNVGVFASTGTSYTQAPGTASYSIAALAFVPISGSTATCTPPTQQTAAIAVTPGATFNAPDLIFTGCQ